MYCSKRYISAGVRLARCCAARLQLDQQVLRTKKERHISPPALSCGGAVFPIKSFIFMFRGNSTCNVALGCRFITAVPRVGPDAVGVVRLDTIEYVPRIEAPLIEVPLRLLTSEEPVETIPGMRLFDVCCFLGYANW